METRKSYLGSKRLDWSCEDTGNKRNNDKCEDCTSYISQDETVDVVVDRSLGTVGFIKNEKYVEAYQDEEIKTGKLYFVCCGGDEGNDFKIEKI